MKIIQKTLHANGLFLPSQKVPQNCNSPINEIIINLFVNYCHLHGNINSALNGERQKNQSTPN